MHQLVLVIHVIVQAQATLVQSVQIAYLQVSLRGRRGRGDSRVICAVDPCTSNPCQNGGQCSWDGVEMNCICMNGYTGTLCQIAPGR